MVDVRMSSGEEFNYTGSGLRWNLTGSVADIVAYRPHNPTISGSNDKNENTKEEKEMTTLTDYVNELESINARAIELRELITNEVAKCGGNVEWNQSDSSAARILMHWTKLKKGDIVVLDDLDGNDESSFELSTKYKVTAVEDGDYEGIYHVMLDNDNWFNAIDTKWHKVG